MTIHVSHSKTDQSSLGVDILIGKSHDSAICPIVALIAYLKTRGTREGPLLVYQNSLPLTKQSVTEELRTLLPLCGVTEARHYAGHSFRIGAATSAAMAGVSEYVIRHLGRWKSDTVRRYIRVDNADLMQVSTRLATLQ